MEAGEKSGKVLMEAFHWQFHPAAHVWRQLLDSGKYGTVISTNAIMVASPGVPDGDIRWKFDLGGGSFMDCTYALSFTRYALRADTPVKILSAVARPYQKDSRVDAAMHATLLFRDYQGDVVQSRVYTDLARSWVSGILARVWELPAIEVETDKAIIHFYNAMMPHLYHYISIADKATGKTEYLRQYFGGPLWGSKMTSAGKGGQWYWSTYRWQLEAFVDKVRGKEPACWVSGDESIAQMVSIDAIYEKAGLPPRPTSHLAK